ncbi:hypothetical protein AAVH_08511 [Aphelenchoides avenae]|nr:hypothetical protein AAVH_08511 [Aphelenchus avenae]
MANSQDDLFADYSKLDGVVFKLIQRYVCEQAVLMSTALRRVLSEEASVEEAVGNGELAAEVLEKYVRQARSLLDKDGASAAASYDLFDDLDRPSQASASEDENAEYPSPLASELNEIHARLNGILRQRITRPVRGYFGKANFDDKGRLVYESRFYPGTLRRRSNDRLRKFSGTSFKFSRVKGNAENAGRINYRCAPCVRLAGKFRACGIKAQSITVLKNDIVDRDPDRAGTNVGHLCHQADLVAQLQRRMEDVWLEEEDDDLAWNAPPMEDAVVKSSCFFAYMLHTRLA